MTLQTWEEEEMLRRIRELEKELREIRALLLKILHNQPHTYQAPSGFSFVPSAPAAAPRS